MKITKEKQEYVADAALDDLVPPRLKPGKVISPSYSDLKVVAVSGVLDQSKVRDPLVASVLEDDLKKLPRAADQIQKVLKDIASKRFRYGSGLLSVGTDASTEAIAAGLASLLDRMRKDDPILTQALGCLGYQVVRTACWRLLFSRGVAAGGTYKFSRTTEAGAEEERIDSFSQTLKSVDKSSVSSKLGSKEIASLQSVIESVISEESATQASQRVSITERTTLTEAFTYAAEADTQLSVWQFVEHYSIHRVHVPHISSDDYAKINKLLGFGPIDALEIPSTNIQYVSSS